jgi:DNA-binding LacI/PurR family transcriptional regulator
MLTFEFDELNQHFTLQVKSSVQVYVFMADQSPKGKSKRVTLQTIADQAGVHKMTVSLALRGHPSIPEVTCLRIRKIADVLDYRPDPMLSALASYRTQNGPGKYTGTLAWVSNDTAPDEWKCYRQSVQFYHGAKAEADRMGYRLEPFSLLELSSTRLRQILRARNIRGLLIAPQSRSNGPIVMDWSGFSVVTFGFSVMNPLFHRVNADHYGNMVTLVERLVRMGFSRIGLVQSASRDERLQYMVSAAFTQQICSVQKLEMLPVLSQVELDAQQLKVWYELHRPQVVITTFPELKDTFAALQIEVPNAVGVVLLSILEEDVGTAGLSENPLAIGSAAVKQLAAMINQNEAGVPTFPSQILIEGRWVDGDTLTVVSD